MLDFIPSTALESLSVIAVALIFVFVSVKKLLVGWKSTDAESNIITLMHTELERMSEQNVVLSNEISRLHSEVIELNKQLRDLTAENQRLHDQIASLTSELNSFKLSLLKGR